MPCCGLGNPVFLAQFSQCGIGCSNLSHDFRRQLPDFSTLSSGNLGISFDPVRVAGSLDDQISHPLFTDDQQVIRAHTSLIAAFVCHQFVFNIHPEQGCDIPTNRPLMMDRVFDNREFGRSVG